MRDISPKFWGVNTEAFSVQVGRGWLVAGGAERVLGDDGKPKTLEGVLGPVHFSMHKGVGHGWTRFCEDSILVYVEQGGVVAAVFDGVSGDADGSGGLASRLAAKTLLNYVGKLLRGDPDNMLEEYMAECKSKISVGATTALILVLWEDGECQVYNKGDSLCYSDGSLVNTPESVGNLLQKYLNDNQPFTRYTFRRLHQVKLCSDGVLNPMDDRTEVSVG
ncbi:MAG: protein phosphatase 2C domain-containing protein [Thermoprotei archaeon]